MSEFWQEYQRQVVSGLWLNSGADPLAHSALGLAGEAGEVADIVKKSQYVGRNLDREHLHEELGDVLWYATSILMQIHSTLPQVAYANILKLEKRHGKDKYNTMLLDLVSA